MPELNEKITFEKYIIVNNAINTDLKNILAGLYGKFNIQFYLHNISLSCITIIEIEKRSILKRSSVGPHVQGSQV